MIKLFLVNAASSLCMPATIGVLLGLVISSTECQPAVPLFVPVSGVHPVINTMPSSQGVWGDYHALLAGGMGGLRRRW
jgi:hypothetical protein